MGDYTTHKGAASADVDQVFVILGRSEQGLEVIGTHRHYDEVLRRVLDARSTEYFELYLVKVVGREHGLVGASLHPVVTTRTASVPTLNTYLIDGESPIKGAVT